MTILQLNAEFYRAMGIIADDETLMTKALNYVKKLAAKKSDPTLMTKEEFYAKVERGEEAYKRGECHEMLAEEDLTTYLRRRGYGI